MRHFQPFQHYFMDLYKIHQIWFETTIFDRCMQFYMLCSSTEFRHQNLRNFPSNSSLECKYCKPMFESNKDFPLMIWYVDKHWILCKISYAEISKRINVAPSHLFPLPLDRYRDHCFKIHKVISFFDLRVELFIPFNCCLCYEKLWTW